MSYHHAPGLFRRLSRLVLTALISLSPILAAHAAEWPTQPLRLIVPFGPGSSPDQMARVVGEEVSRILGQPVVVDNRPGASGGVGTQAIANATPDGYTFGVSITGPMVNNTVLFDHLPYDPFKDLSALTLGVHQYNVLVVSTESGIASIEELLTALRQNPAQYNFPSTAAGTVSHLSVELLLARIGAKAVHVPYTSSPAALRSVIAGDTQFAALPPIAVMPMVKEGRVKALALVANQRSTLLPDLPTLAEVGLPGIEGSGWIGFVISSKVPAEIQKRLADALIQALHTPAVRERLQRQYMEPVGNTPAQFRAYMNDELQRWKPLIEQLGLKAQ